MTLEENIARFGKIVRASKIAPKSVIEVGRSLVMADTRHIGDEDRGKYEHLTLDGLADTHIPEFDGVCYGCNGHAEPMSDVMQMRIMCDTLTLLLKGQNQYAMRYTSDVAKAMKLSGRRNYGAYLEYADCESILDSYYNKLASFDEALRPVFERTSFYLGELKRIQPTVNGRKDVITQDCVASVWLPAEFDAHGFSVALKEPKVITELNGDKTPYITVYNMAFILEVLIKTIVRTDKGDIAQWSFLQRLQEMSKESPESFPVGVGIGSSVRPDVYSPQHFLSNQALRVVYEQHFAKSAQVTMSGVDDTFRAIKRWYGIDTGEGA